MSNEWDGTWILLSHLYKLEFREGGDLTLLLLFPAKRPGLTPMCQRDKQRREVGLGGFVDPCIPIRMSSLAYSLLRLQYQEHLHRVSIQSICSPAD